MRIIAASVLLMILVSALSFKIGAQAQTSATLKVSCMSDGAMHINFDPKP